MVDPRFLAGMLALVCVGTATAQVPPPPPPSPTLWSFLGIPQGLYKLNAQLVNRRGNFPGLEKKPPLKAIADVANLKSDVPAIKAAAEIKQAEDLKPQKIKAIKYLATIGCGCYDKDEKITKALLAATDDCTEDVRLEAVRAVELAAQGEACTQCKQKNCCNEKLVAQLAKMAYERDDKGCYVEPSERVREAAQAALCACCPGGRPPVAPEAPTPAPVEGVEPPTPQVEGVGPEGSAAPGNMQDPPPLPAPDRTTWRLRENPYGRTASVLRPAVLAAPSQGPVSRRGVALDRASITDRQPIADGEEPQPTIARPPTPAKRVTDGPIGIPSRRKVSGHIVHMSPEGDFYHLHLENEATLRPGTQVRVGPAPGHGSVATLEVTSSENGWANARLTSVPRNVRLAQGAAIEAWK